MDIEPIYCAEQIVVPTNLADVLKAYAKEVIRRQPEDLLEFSAIYFANLANISQEVEELVPPSHDQLQVVFTSLNLGEESDDDKVPMHKLVNLCSQAGIAWATLKAAQETGNFGQDGDVSKKEFLAMLLIMSSDNLPAVMSGLFEVFGEGGKLELQDFMQLLRYLKTWDSQITDELFDQVHNELHGSAYLTFASLVDCPPLKEHLAAV